jgi:hypothetical protein
MSILQLRVEDVAGEIIEICSALWREHPTGEYREDLIERWIAALLFASLGEA